ncbi:MAG: HAD family hydrolase [Planctomycetota bacterium]|nr:HAD family hydrolase [Planctomycetota bacterium]
MEELPRLNSIPCVVKIAEKYRGVLPMAIASGGTRRLVEQQLLQIGILDWFDTIVTCEDTVKHKPDPDVFLEAATRLGVSSEYCCVFEDGEPGILAAERASMLCIDVRPHREKVDVGDAVLEMLSQFESVN